MERRKRLTPVPKEEIGERNDKLRNRIRVLVAWATSVYFVWMAYMLLTPRPDVRKVTFGFDLLLMTLHLGAFGILALGVGFSRRQWSTGRWRVALLVWAVASEFLQILSGRYFEFRDIFQNVLGVLIGLETARLIRRSARRRILETRTRKRSENIDGVLGETGELGK